MIELTELERFAEPTIEVDLHVHTTYSRVPDGVPYSPEDVVRRAKTEGLGGVALTGHDTFEGIDEALTVARKIGVILVPGVEITTYNRLGRGFHIPHLIGLFSVEAGLDLVGTKPPTLRRTAYVADWIHDHDGVVIAPHTKERGNPISLSHAEIQALGSRVDGIETHTPKTGSDALAQHVAETHSLASIGSSDAHRLAEIGTVKTSVYGPCDSTDDILEAIKQGRVAGHVDREVSWRRGRRVKEHAASYARRKLLLRP